MQLMPFPEIMQRLRSDNPHDVAAGSGVSYNAVRAIRDGRRKDPKLSTLEKLTRYFEATPR